jgi:O-antigen/teichoic acid export membrane protein
MLGTIGKGALLMVLFKLADRSLGLVSTIVLARLLLPADFGLVAMATTIIALVELASAFNFEVALIQRQNPTREHYDTAWTMNVLLGLGCGSTMILLAYPAALFYSEPRLNWVIVVLAVAWFAQSLENIGVVDFRRGLDFAREFRFLASKRVIAFACTMVLAFLFRNYWALVFGTLIGRFGGLLLSYLMSPFRPRFTLARSRDLVAFSKWLPLTSALSFAQARLSHFFIGKMDGPVSLGVYAIGAELANLPTTEIVAPINRAVLPGLARIADDRAQMNNGFLAITAAISAVALPASIGVATVAEPMVRVVLGTKWLDAVPIIQILAYSGAVTAVASHNFSAYLALGRPGMTAVIGALRVALLIPLMLVLPRYLGLGGFAYAELTSMAVAFVASCALLFPILGLRLTSYVGILWRPLLAGAAMGIVTSSVLHATSLASAAPILQLAVAIPVGVVVYGALMLMLWILCGKPSGIESLVLQRTRACVLACARRDRV